MKTKSIQGTLTAGFLAIAMLTAAVGVVGTVEMLTLVRNEKRLLQIGLNADAAYRIRTNLYEQGIQLRDAIIYFDSDIRRENNMQSLYRLGNELEEHIAYLQENITLAEGQQRQENIIIAEAQQRLKNVLAVYQNSYQPLNAAFLEAVARGDRDSALTVVQDIAEPRDQLMAEAEQLTEQGVNVFTSTSERDSANSIPLLICMILLSALSVVAAVVLGRRIAKSIARPVMKMAHAAEQLSFGDVNVEVAAAEDLDEIGILSHSFQKMADNMRQQSQVLIAVSNGDYTVSIPVRSKEDIINRCINRLIEHGNEMMGAVRQSSVKVSSGAQQISQEAQILATGASRQAATVQEFVSVLQNVLTQVQSTDQYAKGALEAAFHSAREMHDSLQSMQDLQGSMHNIGESSVQISKVVNIIEDFALQTNLLALNASVEAARAGQYGKGFAVVAGEVRTLAAKSADAAQEIGSLVRLGTEHVASSSKHLQKTSGSLKQAGMQIETALHLIEDIASASALQSMAVAELNHGIQSISEVVQNNSATAQQSAAAARNMSSESTSMHQLIQRFKLKLVTAPHRSSPPALHSSEDHSA